MCAVPQEAPAPPLCPPTRCARVRPPPRPPSLPACSCWWNAAAEAQAADRTHRLGQHRSITVVRFFVRDTVEERILALQERKKLVFDSVVGQDNAAVQKLTPEDMRYLFAH